MNGLKIGTSTIDKKADVDKSSLNSMYVIAIKALRKTCKTKEEFDAKCEGLINKVCEQKGQENREFLKKYVYEANAKLGWD